MAKLTDDEIKEIFGEKTFSKGLDYYKGRHVSDTIKLENTLYAHVMGSSPEPYEVRAFINDSKISTNMYLSCGKHVQAWGRASPEMGV